MNRTKTRACGVYWGVVALLFGAGAYQRFVSLPSTPFSDPDTWGYLYPALSGLTKGVFVHTYGRTFVYPLFVYGVLRLFHDFAFISVLQHLLGLGAGAFLLASWRMISPPDSVRAWRMALGLVALAVFLLSKTSLLMEHSIRPEAVFPFFAILCIWLSLRYGRSRNFFGGAALVYDAILLYFIKPAWGFGVLFAILPVLVIEGRVVFKVSVLLVPMFIAYWTLQVPERRLVEKYDPRADRFLPSLLLSVHADMIRDEMARDLTAVPATERQVLEKVIALIDAEIRRNAPNSSKLAVNPDVFLYGKDNVCALLEDHFKNDIAAYRAFCFSYYKKAWQHQPVKMSRKALRQLYAFYSWENQGYDASMKAVISDKDTAVRTMNALKDLPVPCPPYDSYRAASGGLEKSKGYWRQFIPVSLLSMILYGCFPFVILCGVLVSCFWRNALSYWTLYFCSYNFGNCLTIAVVHNMQVGRYVKNQLIFTVLSECCALLLIAAAVARGRRAAPRAPSS